MRVGTDGVLLGAWCSVQDAHDILDIGTGSGLIAIMLAQRSSANIIGIDINAAAVELARKNADASPWKDRIDIVHGDIKDFHPDKTFDLIVSNPPFFEPRRNAIADNRNVARKTVALTHDELIAVSAGMLADRGNFSVIIPTTLADSFILSAWENDLRLVRRTDVMTTPHKPAKRTLLLFSKSYIGATVTDLLVLNDEKGERTIQYAKLTKDFYQF